MYAIKRGGLCTYRPALCGEAYASASLCHGVQLRLLRSAERLVKPVYTVVNSPGSQMRPSD
jgi:hypothetical protein